MIQHNPEQSGTQKIGTSVDRWQSPTGKIVELRFYEFLYIEGDKIRKEQLREVYPPLKDGRIPSSIHEIRECSVCLGAYHQDNIQFCPICRRECCRQLTCLEQITKDQMVMDVCVDCAKAINGKSWSDWWEAFWTLGGQ